MLPSLDEFLALPSVNVYDEVFPKGLSISLLINGTRRWYISQHFNAPPVDNSYFSHYLESVLVELARLLEMLAEHGLYRVFIPVYSLYQPSRNPFAHRFLLKGIAALKSHPLLLETYQKVNAAVRFYGDLTQMPELREILQTPLLPASGRPNMHIYFGGDEGNSYNHTLRLAHHFSMEHGCPPCWEDMLEMYYGDRTSGRLDIMIGFSRLYSGVGIPHLLEGGDRIYATVVTPLVMREPTLRTILYDYLYNQHDIGRDYKDVHPNEIHRLKRFYAANQETVIGLMRKYEDLTYPTPAPIWPDGMETPLEISVSEEEL